MKCQCGREMEYSDNVFLKDMGEGNEQDAGYYCPVCDY